MNKNITLEDLGYSVVSKSSSFIEYQKDDDGEAKHIEIWLDLKIIECYKYDEEHYRQYSVTINMQELQAIYNKCKDLYYYMKIRFKDIVRIQKLEIGIFEEEDSDYVDRRAVRNKERAIYKRLEKVTNDKNKQNEIRDCIYKNMWNTEDLSYKPICDELRALGYEVIDE